MIRPRNESLEAMRKRVSESIEQDRYYKVMGTILIREHTDGISLIYLALGVLLAALVGGWVYLLCR